MAKRPPRPSASPAPTGEVPVVGLREPCPCGSGRRYKACHGRSGSSAPTGRPFEGLVSECDVVALREVVPAATAPLTLLGEHADRDVLLVTVLPQAWPALVRESGTILLGLQVTVGSGDASRDLADVLLRAVEADPGQPIALSRVTPDSPRLQDIIVADVPLDITVHDDFGFWVENPDDLGDDVKASLDRATSFAHPTARLESATAAYWTRMGEKEHLRWFMPHEEEALLDALARLRAAQADDLGADTRLVGMFRAQGLVCPVWDLPLGMGAAATEEPAARFGERLQDALAETTPLSDAQRRARAGLTTRQVTLR